MTSFNFVFQILQMRFQNPVFLLQVLDGFDQNRNQARVIHLDLYARKYKAGMRRLTVSLFLPLFLIGNR